MRKPVDWRAALIMVVLCSLWGFQQVAIKAAARDVSPIEQAAIRCGISAVLVWIVSTALRDRWKPGLARGPGLLVGLLFGIEFLFLAEGLRRTTASHIAVFLYTAPLFAAVGLHLLHPDERLTARQWVGILVSFAGIAVTFLAPRAAGPAAASSSLLGDLLGVCGGAAWGFTTVAVRVSRLSEAPATQTLFYQLVGGVVLLLPIAALTGQLHFHATPLAIESLGFQAIIVSFASYLAWFRLLTIYRAATLGVLAFMSPVFGVAMGAFILGEPLAPSFVFGAALVLVGVVVVNAPSRRVA